MDRDIDLHGAIILIDCLCKYEKRDDLSHNVNDVVNDEKSIASIRNAAVRKVVIRGHGTLLPGEPLY